MRGWVWLLSLPIAVALVAPSTPALAYTDTGYDPRGDAGSFPDVRRSTRKTAQRESGRFLVVAVRAYSDLDEGWVFLIELDTRRGGSADRIMTLYPANNNRGAACSVREEEGADPDRGVARKEGSRAWCRVPMRLLDPTKRIRWWVSSQEGGDPSAGSDRAPDLGWYPQAREAG